MNYLSLSRKHFFVQSTKLKIATALLLGLVLRISILSSDAGSATWKSNPTSGDWDTAANWTPATVPNGPSDTATFASSSQTNISSTSVTEVNGTIFNAGASAFTVRPRFLDISGV